MSWNIIVNSEDCPHKSVNIKDDEICEIESDGDHSEICCELNCPYKEK